MPDASFLCSLRPSAAHATRAVLLLGAVLRLMSVGRPFDHRTLAPWREADYVQIARNYWREDPGLLRPRIDWRRDGPGLVEMEFPIVPWTGGMLFRVLGYHEQVLRLISALAGLAALLLFAGLARRLLPGPGAIAATAFFAVNPLLLYLATAIQPEPLMLFLSLLAVVLIERWDRTGSAAVLLLAGTALGGAILVKAPAACLGFLFAFVVLRRAGLAALARGSVWLAGFFALGPPAAWYLWARRYWLLCGNSLGLSNESPFLGLDMLHRPEWALGLVKWQTIGVFMPLGLVLALAALKAARPATALPLAWLASVWVLLLVSARTTGSGWAFYYHSSAVAPACLLMGAGFVVLSSSSPGKVLGLHPGRARSRLAAVLIAGTLMLLAAGSAVLLWKRDRNDWGLQPMRVCGLEFRERIPVEGRIVVRGGTMVHPRYGSPTAHDQSMLFAWLDRKGFTYGDQELSVATLAAIAARGGRYWIVGADELSGAMRSEAEQRFPQLDSCAPGYALYDLQALTPGRQGAEGSGR